MNETASIHCRAMIEILLSVHALTNMHRASENDAHRRTAAGWIPQLEIQLEALKRELLKEGDE